MRWRSAAIALPIAGALAALWSLMIGQTVVAPLHARHRLGQPILVATAAVAITTQEFLRLFQGVRERWLDQKGLDQVCQSFDGAPETESHPSAARRCRNLDQCYAKALAALPATKPAATAAIAPSPSPAKRGPTAKATAAKAKAPSAPAAVAPPPAAQVAPPPPAEGVPATAESAEAARKAVSAWRCTEPLQVSAAGEDPIAHLIGEDARVAANCR